MESTLEHYVKGQDFATLRLAPGRDDSMAMHVDGRTSWLDVPLYAHEARELIEILRPLANERGEEEVTSQP